MKGCKPLDQKELDRLLKRLDGKYAKRDAAMLMLGVRTGFRISEILSLKIGDVWQFGQVVTVVEVRRKSMKGKRAGRSVPLHTEVRAYLREWVRQSLAAGRDFESPLFWSQKNPAQSISRTSAYDLLKDAAKRARIQGKIGTHTMRKTFAQNVHKRLKDVRKTKEALGHASIDSTISYLSFERSEIDQAILAED